LINFVNIAKGLLVVENNW